MEPAVRALHDDALVAGIAEAVGVAPGELSQKPEKPVPKPVQRTQATALSRFSITGFDGQLRHRWRT